MLRAAALAYVVSFEPSTVFPGRFPIFACPSCICENRSRGIFPLRITGATLFRKEVDQPFEVLELGNADGRSAVFFLPDESHLRHSCEMM